MNFQIYIDYVPLCNCVLINTLVFSDYICKNKNIQIIMKIYLHILDEEPKMSKNNLISFN